MELFLWIRVQKRSNHSYHDKLIQSVVNTKRSLSSLLSWSSVNHSLVFSQTLNVIIHLYTFLLVRILFLAVGRFRGSIGCVLLVACGGSDSIITPLSVQISTASSVMRDD